MVNVYIEEWSDFARDAGGHLIPIPKQLRASQKLTTAGSAANSANFQSETQFIGITSDGAFNFLTGASPTADANDRYLGTLNSPVFLEVVAGQQISVFAAS